MPVMGGLVVAEQQSDKIHATRIMCLVGLREVADFEKSRFFMLIAYVVTVSVPTPTRDIVLMNAFTSHGVFMFSSDCGLWL